MPKIAKITAEELDEMAELARETSSRLSVIARKMRRHKLNEFSSSGIVHAKNCLTSAALMVTHLMKRLERIADAQD